MKITNKLRRTAYHEAGHAYAAYKYGVAIKYVTITPNEDFLGCVQSKRKITSRQVDCIRPGEYRNQKFYNKCIILFAGRASEKYFCARSSHYGASGDRAAAADIALSLFGPSEVTNAALRLFYVQANVMVATPNAQLLIPALAERLLEKKTLTGDEVKQLFRGVIEAKFALKSASDPSTLITTPMVTSSVA